ncbi:DUF2157 domain-containing protein [Ruegeria sp. WL0004]|uniref:DUF2157 domain-containing protein n=1 Tax=Ruegeria marisflavi TaxID=2984152 RepID=A0ABT2WP36_9RHOB|nr:DUF2157 domain-containing protein [Ruegeria sp. WL0004]MCU9837413.1 DUF2157 domain-containing protein [Ruegeria sp. WL0004]
MFAVADTDKLVDDGVIAPEAAREIEARSRQAMVTLGINTVLCLGILSATGGLIFWLQDPLAVAVVGLMLLAGGFAILSRGGGELRMFGNAAALIGAGMLCGGGTVELVSNHPQIAGQMLSVLGGLILAGAMFAFVRDMARAPFVTGAVALMGLAMHVGGLGYLIADNGVSGLLVSLFYFYTAGLLVAGGWLLDVRLITALAIVPFAQMLDTGTFYFHAAYVFYSPESTLSILQMAVLLAACLWVAGRYGERTARHARILAMLGFVVANLCALVGSLWGDVVGETIWGPAEPQVWTEGAWDAYSKARDAFRDTALVISEGVYSVLWAAALVALLFWSAHRGNRGLFNASLVFGVIHAYTQMFESFGEEPLAYVIGGLALIPIAWGMWRFDRWIKAQASAASGVQHPDG